MASTECAYVYTGFEMLQNEKVRVFEIGERNDEVGIAQVMRWRLKTMERSIRIERSI